MVVKRRAMMFVLSSPSGVGKTTLTKKLAKNSTNFTISISHTTREPRPNEINGKDYYFVSKEKFDSLIKKNSFFEYAKIFDNYYGTLKEPVLKLLSFEKDVLFDIDWQGTQQLKKIKNLSIQSRTRLPLVTFFIIPPNIQVLKNRLFNRHKGQEKLIAQRMSKFSKEISHWDEYDYVLVNDDLEDCYDHILKIINCVKKGETVNQNFREIKKKIEELSK